MIKIMNIFNKAQKENLQNTSEEGLKKERKPLFRGFRKKARNYTQNAAEIQESTTNKVGEPGTATRRKKAISPVTMAIVIAIIIGGPGTYVFIELKGGFKGLKSKSHATRKRPTFKPGAGENMAGIKFGDEALPGTASETGIPSDHNDPGAETQVVAAPASLHTEPTPIASITPEKIERNETGGASSHAAATTGTSPSSPTSLQAPPASVQNALPVVTTPVHVNDKLPVPIKLALADDAPFKSRFEKRYTERLAAKNPKGTNTNPGEPGGQATARGVPPKLDITALIGPDGKPLAPGLAPGAMDINGLTTGALTVEKVSLYGVMVSADKKVAITSKGEIQVGGMLHGEKIVDITPDGVKLASGRMLQVASE